MAGANAADSSPSRRQVIAFRFHNWEVGMRILLGVTLLAALSGCATSPIPAEQATPVPRERITFSPVSSSDNARITITRDDGWVAGGGCFVAVLIDGKLAARIGTGERVEFSLPPGRHIVGMSGDPQGRGLCGLQVGQPLRETATELMAGDIQRFRISGDSNSGLDIRPTSF